MNDKQNELQKSAYKQADNLKIEDFVIIPIAMINDNPNIVKASMSLTTFIDHVEVLTGDLNLKEELFDDMDLKLKLGNLTELL